MTRCSCNKVIPKAFRNKPILQSAKARHHTQIYNLQMVNVARNEAKQRYHELLDKIKLLTEELKHELSEQDFADIQRVTEKSREQRHVKEKNRLKDKFNHLSGTDIPTYTTSNIVKTSTLVLSKDVIPDEHKELLNLGPNFVPAFNRAPIMDIVTSVEAIASRMNTTTDETCEAELLRHDVSNILEKYVNKKLPTNLTKQQSKALREMKSNNNLKIVPFDKGNGFAVLDSKDMFDKINDQLGEAREIEKDPTKTLVNKFQVEISRLRKEDKINKQTFYAMYPSDAVPPRLYGLIKAHKPSKNFPMRCVVSTIGTPYYGTSSYLVKLIQPTLNKCDIRVINSASFVDEAKDWTIDANEIQVSFDVVALYPSIPIKRAIDAMMHILQNDEADVRERTNLSMSDIRKLLELSLSTCYFLWNDKIYSIEDSGPIGLSLMVVIAEGYLQFIEKNAMDVALVANVAPKTFKRYVDDSHARFDTCEEMVKFHQILNEQDERIQYTIENEVDGGIAFLDVKLQNNRDGKYEFQVYRKDAITNVQIKPTSSVDPKMYIGVFKGFLARAIRICSDQHLKDEVEFLIKVFIENGYSEIVLRNTSQKYLENRSNSRESIDQTTQKVVKIPWIPILGPKLRSALKKRNIKTVFTSGRSLKDILCKHKSALPRNSYAGVYAVQCGCSKTYIGESKKRVATRLKEHERDIFHGRWSNTGAAGHAAICTNNFSFEEAQTIAYESSYHRRKVREALEIRLATRTGTSLVNRDEGTICTTTQWNPLLGRLTSVL